MDQIIEMYLNYYNKFITVESFAEWYWLDNDDAQIIIDMGRKYNQRKTDQWYIDTYWSVEVL